MFSPKQKQSTITAATLASLLLITEEEIKALARKKILIRAGKNQYIVAKSVQNYIAELRIQNAEKSKPPRYTSADVAEWTGLTQRRVQQFITEGVMKKNDDGSMQVKQCILAYVGYLKTLATQRRTTEASGAKEEKIKLESERLRTRLLKDKGELMFVADHRAIVGATIGAAKAKMLGIPSRIGEKAPVKLRNDVVLFGSKLIHEALQELSAEKLEFATLKKRGK